MGLGSSSNPPLALCRLFHKRQRVVLRRDLTKSDLNTVTSVTRSLIRRLSGGGSPELIESQTDSSDCCSEGEDLHGIIVVPNHGDDQLLNPSLKEPSTFSQTLPVSDSASPPATPPRSCLVKNKGVSADDIQPLCMEAPYPSRSMNWHLLPLSPLNYSSGESSRFSSSRISVSTDSFSNSFTSHSTDHMTRSSSSHISSPRRDRRASVDLCRSEVSSSSSSTITTFQKSPIFFAVSPGTNHCNEIRARPPSPQTSLIKLINIFQQQELSKHVLAVTIGFAPGVLILHHSSPKTMTWGMSMAIVELLSVGVAALWNSNLLQDQYPVYAHRIQMLGFALSLAAFWGLMACFLRHSLAVAVPITCWVISAVILAAKAYNFKAPGRARNPEQ